MLGCCKLNNVASYIWRKWKVRQNRCASKYITLRVLFGDSTADATRISPSINGREIAVQSFFCNNNIKDILLLWLFLNVQYPIDPAVISLLNVNRQYLLCVLRYETRAAIGWFKIEQSGKPTSEKMTSNGSVSDLPADIVSVDRVLIRLGVFRSISDGVYFSNALTYFLTRYKLSFILTYWYSDNVIRRLSWEFAIESLNSKPDTFWLVLNVTLLKP